jgi:hypothetical protein
MGSNPVTLIMRYANHIILDFESSKNNQTSQYWVIKFIHENTNEPTFLTSVKILDLLTIGHTKFNSQQPINSNLSLLANQNTGNNNSYLNTNLSFININFLRKEKLYTKLKYSRSPAYDIVSGGAAAIFAGFLGFLVSEKFGFELVDSGDFYFLTMYIVFLCFSVRPLLTVSEPTKSI